MRARLIVASVAVALLSGCASVVSGHGAASVSPSPTGPTGFPASGSGSVSPVAPSTTASGFARFPRRPVPTAIGDPPTADLCTAIGLSALSHLGYPPKYGTSQPPPGCYVQLTKSGQRVASVDVYASTEPPQAQPGRRSTRQSGLVVYVYPYESSIGDCERDVVAQRVFFHVHAFANEVPASRKRAVACNGTAAMTTRLAQVVAAHEVPRLSLADPSLSAMDACAVVQASGLLSQSRYTGMKLAPDAFGSGCTLSKGSTYLYFDYSLVQHVPVPDTRPVVTHAHQMYAYAANGSGYCTFGSVQGTTGDGKHEVFELSANSSSSDTALCDATQQALATYLDTAGLH